MQIAAEYHQHKRGVITALQADRLPWWNTWRRIAEFYIPKRYVWLTSPNEQQRYLNGNTSILDATGTLAGRVEAAGMMNGITSPSSPWFKLRIPGKFLDQDMPTRRWLDEVERIMLLIMAESNFYNALALIYLDLVFFGTGAMLIYEDDESVIRCYNSALGEYYLGQSARLQVNIFAREFYRQAHQMAEQWGLENCCEQTKLLAKASDGRRHQNIRIIHLIEPNDNKIASVPKYFPYREIYWEEGAPVGTVLSARGFHEMPGIFPRWELTGNDNYGTSPGMDALGDVIQLQVETKRKAQALNYMVMPHMLMDVSLQGSPNALVPGGQTFVSANSFGAKPAHEVRLPIAELTADLREIQFRIQRIFSNDLFRAISDLQTVRSATEVELKHEERLVQLGPVLERFENEALDPAIKRIFGIATRAGLLPEAPESIRGVDLEIQYVSPMATAQTAVGVTSTERFLQVIGNLAPIVPEILELPNFMELMRDYARDIGVKAKGLNSPDEIAQRMAAKQEAQAQNEGLQQAQLGAETGKLLSETEVGGGANALQRILGG